MLTTFDLDEYVCGVARRSSRVLPGLLTGPGALREGGAGRRRRSRLARPGGHPPGHAHFADSPVRAGSRLAHLEREIARLIATDDQRRSRPAHAEHLNCEDPRRPHPDQARCLERA
ncbi:hypothetical protein HBB16_10060 [Pseudonocardia sp. MCCB 268]|nr:hypothetical protein [Pseudonocardia cytotoxica]